MCDELASLDVRHTLEIWKVRELAADVDGAFPTVVVFGSWVCWFFLAGYPVGHCSEDQSANQVLAEIADVGDGVQDLAVGALPDKGVGDDDCRRVAGWPPVGRQVDDRWRLSAVEQDVASEVSMDELAGGRDRAQREDQL